MKSIDDLIKVLEEKDKDLEKLFNNSEIRRIFNIISDWYNSFTGEYILNGFKNIGQDEIIDLLSTLEEHAIIQYSRYTALKEHEHIFPTFYKPYELTEYGIKLLKKNGFKVE